jgi:pimeloyl-ACP methyl ester carboxylesterase
LKKNMTNSAELQLLPFDNPPAPAVSLAYRYNRPQEGKPVFLWLGGFKSDMDGTKAEGLAAWAREHGAGCLRFDYSGHGLSGGRFEDGTLSQWLAQARTMLAMIESHRTILVGSSMGGWIALLLAQQLSREGKQPPSALVLIAPAWQMTSLMWEQAPEEARDAIASQGAFYRPSEYGEEPYTITRTLIEDGKRHRIEPDGLPPDLPIRIIHGREDRDVPWERSLRIIERVPCQDMRLTLVKDAGHRLSRPQDLALLFAALEEFLA